MTHEDITIQCAAHNGPEIEERNLRSGIKHVFKEPHFLSKGFIIRRYKENCQMRKAET